MLGIGAALVGSLLPAREAARAQPAIALKDVGDAADPRARPHARHRARPSVGRRGAPRSCRPIGELPLFGYLSIGLLLAGGIAAMPLLARLLLTPLQRLGRVSASADLALKRLWGAPSQAAIALGGIVASTSLMIAMAVMVSSFRGSVDDVAGAGAARRPLSSPRWRQQPGCRAAAQAAGDARRRRRSISARWCRCGSSAERPAVALVAQTIDRDNPAANAAAHRRFALAARRRRRRSGCRSRRCASTAIAPARRSTCPSWAEAEGKPARFFVAGIWRDYGRQQGAITMDAQDYTAITGDTTRTDGSVELDAGRVGRRGDRQFARGPAAARWRSASSSRCRANCARCRCRSSTAASR